jgi:phosphopantothenoylcysteine decarboxylase / phosphopantothenate---cysteine ligase
MNERMYTHPAVRENLALLRSHGCRVMDPASGELACGVIGKGRMPEPPDILNFIRAALAPKDFAGIRALVTAGPTREPLDPVRFLSNPSSGLMGYSLARALGERGAAVTLISGPTGLACPAGVELVAVTTTGEMHRAVLERYDACSLVIKAAAPLDFRPARVEGEKVKKEEAPLVLELAHTPDILKELGRQKGNRILVGFAAETERVEEHARRKLRDKNLDLIIVNDLTAAGAGFAAPTNQVLIIDARGEVEELPLMEKESLAHRILDRVAALHPSRSR